MGMSLTKLKTEAKDEDNVLVTIITDGYENASREYSGKAIVQLVEELKAKGWIFAYIGANQDVEKVAFSMGINNSMRFDANVLGSKAMFKEESANREAYYCCISEGISPRQLSKREYFRKNNLENTRKDSTEKKEEKKNKRWWPF